jgi:hypothetical protein
VNHKRIEYHIDDKILDKLSSKGLTLELVKSDIISSIDRFSTRDSFIDVSKFYLLRNWGIIDLKKKYTTYYVIHSLKRLNDINWLIENKDRFPNLCDSQLFSLLRFKEKIR